MSGVVSDYSVYPTILIVSHSYLGMVGARRTCGTWD